MRKITLIGLLVFLSGQVFGASKVAAELQTLAASESVDVIVQFTQAPTAIQHQLVAGHSGTLRTVLQSANAGLYRMPSAGIAALAAESQVSYISANRVSYAMLDYAAAAVTANIAAQYQFDGRGIGIAVIDSGVSAVADLNPRIVYSESFVPTDSSTVDAYMATGRMSPGFWPVRAPVPPAAISLTHLKGSRPGPTSSV